jgi:hypothetical protein
MNAVFSEDRMYRYVLRRDIAPGTTLPEKPVLFIMLNPSLASEHHNDPTIRRCISFAKAWGGTSLTVVNLFAYVTPLPDELYVATDPIGPDNDMHLQREIEAHSRSGMIVAAWGAESIAQLRGLQVTKKWGPFECFGTTQSGAPRHPLYRRADSILTPYASTI